jgi:hypothetical protein
LRGVDRGPYSQVKDKSWLGWWTLAHAGHRQVAAENSVPCVGTLPGGGWVALVQVVGGECRKGKKGGSEASRLSDEGDWTTGKAKFTTIDVDARQRRPRALPARRFLPDVRSAHGFTGGTRRRGPRRHTYTTYMKFGTYMRLAGQPAGLPEVAMERLYH